VVNRLPGAAVLFLSGTAALVFQLLWIKQLSIIVGVDVYAVTIAVSAFFAGLAIGNAVLGRRADAVARPVWFYAVLEAGIAAAGILATITLAHAAAPFAILEARIGALAWALPFVLVGVPAFLMGGTIPVMLRAVRPSADGIGGAGGALYAANTAGAIAGHSSRRSC
jgi:spermidine synthase